LLKTDLGDGNGGRGEEERPKKTRGTVGVTGCTVVMRGIKVEV
jgi:hypothetical protein